MTRADLEPVRRRGERRSARRCNCSTKAWSPAPTSSRRCARYYVWQGERSEAQRSRRAVQDRRQPARPRRLRASPRSIPTTRPRYSAGAPTPPPRATRRTGCARWSRATGGRVDRAPPCRPTRAGPWCDSPPSCGLLPVFPARAADGASRRPPHRCATAAGSRRGARRRGRPCRSSAASRSASCRSHGGGFRVEGEQVSVAVDAPERLARVRRALERERVETRAVPAHPRRPRA